MRAGAWIAAAGHDVAAVLYGGTRRTRETAEGIARGVRTTGAVPPVVDAFALRNPDLYLGGARVSMVSTAQAFANQTDGMTAAEVAEAPFFGAWLQHPERVGFWVAHQTPPGDDATAVARRMDTFAASLADKRAWRGRTVVAVTHSPVLRAVGLHLHGTDAGEPPYVNGYAFTVRTGSVEINEVAPATS